VASGTARSTRYRRPYRARRRQAPDSRERKSRRAADATDAEEDRRRRLRNTLPIENASGGTGVRTDQTGAWPGATETAPRPIGSAPVLGLKDAHRLEMHLAFRLSRQVIEVANIFSALQAHQAHHKPSFSVEIAKLFCRNCPGMLPLRSRPKFAPCSLPAAASNHRAIGSDRTLRSCPSRSWCGHLRQQGNVGWLRSVLTLWPDGPNTSNPFPPAPLASPLDGWPSRFICSFSDAIRSIEQALTSGSLALLVVELIRNVRMVVHKFVAALGATEIPVFLLCGTRTRFQKAVRAF